MFAHRLIAENTVDAAIQRMQARKQALEDALFEGTGRGPLAPTEEVVQALFGAGGCVPRRDRSRSDVAGPGASRGFGQIFGLMAGVGRKWPE